MKPLLLIRHDTDDTFGVASPTLEAEGIELAIHNAWEDGASLPAPSEISGIVLFGGAMNVDQTDSHPFLARERDLVRAAVSGRVPYLGICLGAQLLARALDVEVFPAPVKEIGFAPLHPTDAGRRDPLLSAFSPGDMVFHWHEDTFRLPPGSELLATGERVRVQAYRAGQQAWGLQFHLEIDRPELELWTEGAGPGLEGTWGKSRDQLMDEAGRFLATQEERARELFRRFADRVRVGAPGPAPHASKTGFSAKYTSRYRR